MRARSHLIATAVAAVAVCAALAGSVGHLAGTNVAQAKAYRLYTLRVGDRALIASVGQQCTVEIEGGAPELFCSRRYGAHHQVTFFRNNILVWKLGNPDNAAWSGKP
jgi:hypothetical protein